MPEPITNKEEDKILKQARKRWKYVKECDFEKKQYRENSKKELKYFTGEDQGWEEGRARSDLVAKGRPAITLNRIAPIIRLLCGARPKTDARYSPVEEGDPFTAEVFNNCKDHIENKNLWDFIEADWFLHGVVLRRSVIEIKPNYDMDIQGEIELSLEPGDEYWFDPDSKRKDRRDGKYFFRQRRISPDEAKELWPDKATEIDTLKGYVDGDDTSGSAGRDSGLADEYQDPRSDYYDATADKLGIVYYWYKERTEVTKITDTMPDPMTGELKVYESPKSVKEVKKTLPELGPAAEERYKVMSVHNTQVKYLVFCHEIEFERGITPWEREDGQRSILAEQFPVVCFEPDRLFQGGRSELISLIEPLEDPQKFHNKLASAVIEIIGTAAASGWEWEKGALSEPEKRRLKEHGGKPGVQIEWNKGAISENKRAKITPNAPPMAEIAVAKQMAEALLDISGEESLISTEALGKGASGKAIDLKQRQGASTISWVYDSLRFFKHILAEYIRDAIQVLFNYEKVIRIKGKSLNQAPQYVRINERMYDEVGGITQILNDVTTGKYDVAISDKEVMPTMRIERFRLFVELVQTGALQLPPEVMIKIVLALMDDQELKDVVETELSEYVQMAQQAQQGQMEPAMPAAAMGNM